MEGNRFAESKEGVEGINHLEKLLLEKPKTSLTRFCDTLLEINIKEDTYRGFVFSENGSLFLNRKTGSYNYILHRFCEKNCNPEEEEEVFGYLMLSNLVKECGNAENNKAVRTFFISKTQMWMETCAYTMEREDGRYLVLMLADVTQEKDMEFKLNQCVSETIHAMDAASQSRSEFMERISQDFRDPVESIISLLGMARENIHHPIILEDYIKKMENTSRYMMSLIGDIRDISFLEAGKTVLERESFDLMALMNGLTRRIQKQANDKLLGFTIEEKGRLFRDYYLIGDAKKLYRVLENILSNAIKYTPSGGQIMFSYGETGENDGMADMEFSIQDNGVGISKESLPHIFEPFWQREREEHGEYDAKGLSLTISRRFIQLMNGKIEVESKEGEGSCFTVYVTLEKGMAIEKEDKPKVSDQNGKRILLADTSLLDAETVATYLEMNAFDVDKAAKGADVVEKFKKAPKGYYLALILDESMPIKSGSVIAREIRSIERENPDKYDGNPVPIIIMTKKAIPLEQELFKNRIINGVLQKPLDSDRLLGTIATLRQGI